LSDASDASEAAMRGSSSSRGAAAGAAAPSTRRSQRTMRPPNRLADSVVGGMPARGSAGAPLQQGRAAQSGLGALEAGAAAASGPAAARSSGAGADGDDAATAADFDPIIANADGGEDRPFEIKKKDGVLLRVTRQQLQEVGTGIEPLHCVGIYTCLCKSLPLLARQQGCCQWVCVKRPSSCLHSTTAARSPMPLALHMQTVRHGVMVQHTSVVEHSCLFLCVPCRQCPAHSFTTSQCQMQPRSWALAKRRSPTSRTTSASAGGPTGSNGASTTAVTGPHAGGSRAARQAVHQPVSWRPFWRGYSA
jgi:hypothetical protein